MNFCLSSVVFWASIKCLRSPILGVLPWLPLAQASWFLQLLQVIIFFSSFQVRHFPRQVPLRFNLIKYLIDRREVRNNSWGMGVWGTNAVMFQGKGLYSIFQHSRSVSSYRKGCDISASSENLGFCRVSILRRIRPDIHLHFQVPGFPLQVLT